MTVPGLPGSSEPGRVKRQRVGLCRVDKTNRGDSMRRSMIKAVGTVLAVLMGIYAVYLGGMHGYYEIMNGMKNPGGIVFDAISGNSLATEFTGWPGWPAFSIIPDVWITGVVVFILDGMLLIWLFLFFNRKQWGAGLLCLSIFLFLFGGGFKPPFLGAMAGGIGIIAKKTDSRPE
jgi:hypothetical protein